MRLPVITSAFMNETKEDVLTYMNSPAEHRPKLYSNNGLERLNGEIKRRTEAVYA